MEQEDWPAATQRRGGERVNKRFSPPISASPRFCESISLSDVGAGAQLDSAGHENSSGHNASELLTNAIVVPSGDHDGTLIVP